MRVPYLILGIALILFSLPWFLSPRTWAVGILLDVLAIWLILSATREPATTYIQSVTAPRASDEWHRAAGVLPPPPSPPLPVVMKVEASPLFYSPPSIPAPFVPPPPPSTPACPQCGRTSPAGWTFCAYCGHRFA